MGSGHILCVLFDVLVRIYEDYGYTAREAAVKIVENNLWGLDIDERAAQLSYFAVMMKARQYDRRFFTRKVQPHVYAIEESNGITSAPMHDMGLNLSQEEYSTAAKQAMRLVEEMYDAKEYGSLIHVTPCDWDLLRRFAVPRDEDGQLHLNIHGEIEASARLQSLINIGEALSQRYHTVVTNPPYMGVGGMGAKLANMVKKEYPDSKADLFSVFIERSGDLVLSDYFIGIITQHVWMFISSFEKLRNKFAAFTIINMAHLGARAFEEIGGEVVQTTSFVYRRSHCEAYKGKYKRLVDGQSQGEKERLYFDSSNVFIAQYTDFMMIPGRPIAYWLSDEFRASFSNGSILDISEIKQGLATCNNNLFLREWHEVQFDNIGFNFSSGEETLNVDTKWFPYNKGGGFRKWYGNCYEVVNWRHGGEDIHRYNKIPLDFQAAPVRAKKYYFRSGITYGLIATKGFSARNITGGFIFDVGGSMLFPPEDKKLYILGFLNSSVAQAFLKAINPTLNYQVGDIGKLPLIWDNNHVGEIEKITTECIRLCKKDWDEYETSWDFSTHPMIKTTFNTVSEATNSWIDTCIHRFSALKECEERLNNLFASIYHVDTEVSSVVDDEKVSIRIVEVQSAVKTLISYSVGCMFGRYSLDSQGLAYAGGMFDLSKYKSFQPDKDGIIPVCDDEYFEDDIVGRFVSFIEVVYGRESLEENLRFIADALGGKGSSREVIRSYFINDFYADHLKMYQKRPIYWLFDSGKKNGFKCLIYMHRYQPDTIARIRTDYVHEQQSRYRTAIADLEQRISSASTSERVKLSKQLITLKAQAEEIRVYEEKVHHLADKMIQIDLDDGVKTNYAIFKDILSKI